MSELFDSLRRGREASPPQPAPGTAQGDAVLATLGYTPVRGGGPSSGSVRILVAAGVIGLCWVGWRFYTPDREATPSSATPSAATPYSATPSSATPSSATPSSATPLEVTPRTARGGANPIAPVMPAPRRILPRPLPSPVTRTETPVRPPFAVSPPAVPDTPNDFQLALYYHRAGDFENALRHYTALLQRDEMNAQAHNNLGLLYLDKGLLEESARALRRATVIEPRNVRAHNNYGVTLLKQKNIDGALVEFRTALTLEPRNIDTLVNMALARKAEGQTEVSKELLLQALSDAPKSAAAHYNLAVLYDETSEPGRALDHYRKFLENVGADDTDQAPAVRARVQALTRYQD